MATMRVVQVSPPNGPLEIVERQIPEPGSGSVRIKVQACGICHSDSMTKEGAFPGIQYPRVPGHEVAGVVDAVAPGVAGLAPGQRVGVGWHGGYCGHCDHCCRGEFFAWVTGQVTGLTFDGGYEEFMIAPVSAVARMPDDLPAVDAAPLMCAGITTFNALRNSGTRPPDLIAVLGIGGLGHLGVQFAVKMGFRTVAIARGKGKEPLAHQLGAHHYIDSQAENVSEQLQKLGGAKVVLATATSNKAMADTLGGLGVNGKIIILGASFEPLPVNTLPMIGGRQSIAGWPSGSSIDSEDTLAFSALSGVRPMTEVFPLERAAEAYERMMSNKARFRVVLTTGN